MTLHWKMRLVPLCLLVFVAVSLCHAQGLSCDEVTAIAGMAKSTSNQSLSNWRKKAGESYTAHLVYSFRSFELQPTEREAASRLLSMIPPTKEEQPLWNALDGFLCKEQRVRDIKALAELHARMSNNIARAVLLVPEKMRDYVSYAYDSVQDPHSDYAVRMQLVCRA